MQVILFTPTKSIIHIFSTQSLIMAIPKDLEVPGYFLFCFQKIVTQLMLPVEFNGTKFLHYIP